MLKNDVRFNTDRDLNSHSHSCGLQIPQIIVATPLQSPTTIAKLAIPALLNRKAIEQPIAARAAQIGLAATAVRAARGMRRIP